MRLILTPKEYQELQAHIDRTAVTIENMHPEEIKRVALSNFFVGKNLELLVEGEDDERPSNSTDTDG